MHLRSPALMRQEKAGMCGVVWTLAVPSIARATKCDDLATKHDEASAVVHITRSQVVVQGTGPLNLREQLIRSRLRFRLTQAQSRRPPSSPWMRVTPLLLKYWTVPICSVRQITHP